MTYNMLSGMFNPTLSICLSAEIKPGLEAWVFLHIHWAVAAANLE